MIIVRTPPFPPPTAEEVVLSGEDLERFNDQMARFDRNSRWFESHAIEIGESHRGRHICIAGGELFVGDDPLAVRAAARAAHPGDADAVFAKFISPFRGPRIYANRRPVGGV